MGQVLGGSFPSLGSILAKGNEECTENVQSILPTTDWGIMKHINDILSHN